MVVHDSGEDAIGETRNVVDSLTTVVYSILEGNTFEDTILTAVNLGYDTDTNAAINGALAGIFYGNRKYTRPLASCPETARLFGEWAERFARVMNT